MEYLPTHSQRETIKTRFVQRIYRHYVHIFKVIIIAFLSFDLFVLYNYYEDKLYLTNVAKNMVDETATTYWKMRTVASFVTNLSDQ